MLYEDLPDLRRDSDHKYWLGSENLFGVNEVIIDNRLESDEYFTETHSTRGQAIHAVLAGAARGLTFDWDLLDPDLHGWVRSGINYLDYLLDDGAVILGIETMRYNDLYRFAGAIDLVVFWRGYEWILDWKSGKASKMTRFKLAAYDTILGPTKNGKIRKRAAIEVQKDGSRAKLVEYNKPENFHDANRFLSYLNTSRDRKLFGAKDSLE